MTSAVINVILYDTSFTSVQMNTKHKLLRVVISRQNKKLEFSLRHTGWASQTDGLLTSHRIQKCI